MKIPKNKQTISLFAFLAIFACKANSLPFEIAFIKDGAIKKQVIAAASKSVDKLGEVEEGQIVLLARKGFPSRYLVPLRVNGGNQRGCYVADVNGASFLANPILLTPLEELESCEVILSVFGCNRAAQNGVVVLYGKRLGFDHYSFEGTYLEVRDDNSIHEIQELSNRLTGQEKASAARKALHCK